VGGQRGRDAERGQRGQVERRTTGQLGLQAIE